MCRENISLSSIVTPKSFSCIPTIKVGMQAGRYEWLLGSIYMNCEGVRGDGNVVKMQRVKDVVRNAKDEGLKIMIGGDRYECTYMGT